ncbi:hypothetical protein NDU88_006917 [Pleurodeles waltl]|uniref:Uncharacterized protein n=1 Tax=Pleurodeles waltl TaxID=8319 RepID=A0AAV7LQI8_PLEWA|nr:hypothetical protein NDU88_006917 [Pleurodeles waltl]
MEIPACRSEAQRSSLEWMIRWFSEKRPCIGTRPSFPTALFCPNSPGRDARVGRPPHSPEVQPFTEHSNARREVSE